MTVSAFVIWPIHHWGAVDLGPSHSGVDGPLFWNKLWNDKRWHGRFANALSPPYPTPFNNAVSFVSRDDIFVGGFFQLACLQQRNTALPLACNNYLRSMRAEDILVPTTSGICCKPGGFHIDPTQPVEKAVITHGHSDHARAGHRAVLATQETLDIMRLRYGDKFAGSVQALPYGETLKLGRARVSLHPAGHVLGSAQIRVEYEGLRVVASGDYKNVADPTCVPFELLPCDIFITEATFGLPVFRHHDADGEISKLLHSTMLFPERTHLVGAYTLGKAQRIMALLRAAGYDKPIYIHGAVETITRYYQARGVILGQIELVCDSNKTDLAGQIVICPPSAMTDLWSRRFPDPVAAFASGWMRVRARARQRGVTLPLVISDHADWDGLTTTITASGASEVWVTHGQEDALVHWCRTRGVKARPLYIVGYGNEDESDALEADV
jgi:putative mRNA 3-end processing factor